jgi:hypothetical protein
MILINYFRSGIVTLAGFFGNERNVLQQNSSSSSSSSSCMLGIKYYYYYYSIYVSVISDF